jgi:hypothetical protein
VEAKKTLVIVAAVGILVLMFKVSTSMQEQNIREEAEAESELNRVTKIEHKAVQDKRAAEHSAEAAAAAKAAETVAKTLVDKQRYSKN